MRLHHSTSTQLYGRNVIPVQRDIWRGNFWFQSYCHVYQWLKTGFGLVIGFIDHLQVVTTNNYNTVTVFHTTNHPTLISSVYLHQSSRIYNSGTIKISLNHTFPIRLHYTTRKVFKSHVKSLQADFLYSSVLVELTACLLVRVFLPLLLTRNSVTAVLLQLTATLFACFCRYYSLITALNVKVKVKVKVMLRPTVQSASPSWNKAPIWGLRPDIYYCQAVAGFLLWGSLSDERTGLSFARLSVLFLYSCGTDMDLQ
jgi:hypothetical protein